MINVTQVFLPPIEEYFELLKGVWERNHITNHGPLVFELEDKLKSRLGLKHISYVNNGTTAIQVAIKALDLTGEIITTPFSYVATTSSVVWEGLQPVFADIDPFTLCIDPKKIEEKITPNTSGILATHVYGNPCDVVAIQAIADKYNIKVIYDAAHAFDVEIDGKSLLSYGDISTISFHATKLFHTCEGGAVITKNAEILHKVNYSKNFGHNGPEEFFGVGINGKNSELHAAMGIALFPYIDEIIYNRKVSSEYYDKNLNFNILSKPFRANNVKYNYAYYPVLFPNEELLLLTKNNLASSNIFPRRYFYPSLNQLPYLDYQSCKVSEDISSRALCLPLFSNLTTNQLDQIISIINKSLQ